MSRRVLLEEGREYQLGGGFGSWALSFERGVRRGDVRVIDGILMYAYSVYKEGWFGKRRVNWRPVNEKLNYEWANVEAFKNGKRPLANEAKGAE